MAFSEEEELELEAEAEALAELELEEEERSKALFKEAQRPASLLKETWEGVKQGGQQLVGGLGALASGATELVQEAASRYGAGEPLVGAISQSVKRRIEESPGAATRLAATAATVPLAAGMGPIGMVAAPTLAGYAAGKLNQAIGFESKPTASEEYRNLIADVVSNAAIPVGTMAVKKIGGAINRELNDPIRVAKKFGATPGEVNIDPRKNIDPIQNKIQRLAQTSPEFSAKVMGEADILKAAESALAQRQAIGAEIGEIYANNKGLAASIDDIKANPSYLELLDDATNPAKAPELKVKAATVLSQLDEPINAIANANNNTLPLAQLWETRKSLDELIGKFNTANPGAVDDGLLKARTAVQDAINSTIKKLGGTEQAERLSSLNSQYSNLSDVSAALARQHSKLSGISNFDLSNRMLSPRDLTFNALGLGSNRARALAYRLGNANLPEVVGASLTSAFGTSLLPRDTEEIVGSEKHLHAAAKLATMMGVVAQPTDFIAAPNNVKQEIIRDLAMTSPNSFEPTGDNYTSVINNKIHSSAERDQHARAILNEVVTGSLDKREEPRKLGPLMSHGTYVPLRKAPPVSQPINNRVHFRLSDINNALGAVGSISGLKENIGSTESERLLRQAAKYPNAY